MVPDREVLFTRWVGELALEVLVDMQWHLLFPFWFEAHFSVTRLKLQQFLPHRLTLEVLWSLLSILWQPGEGGTKAQRCGIQAIDVSVSSERHESCESVVNNGISSMGPGACCVLALEASPNPQT